MPLRLSGTDRPSAGRVEVWRDGVWAAVSTFYLFPGSGLDAGAIGRVACRMLGYNQSIISTSDAYSMPNVNVVWESLNCTGKEASILDCTFPTGYRSWSGGLYSGGPRKELGVECFPDGGERWAAAAAGACTGLAAPRGAPSPAAACAAAAWATFAAPPFAVCRAERPSLAAAVRLLNGSVPNEGRLELLHAGQWWPVCRDSFQGRAAWVACQQAGWVGGPAAAEVLLPALYGSFPPSATGAAGIWGDW